MLLRLARALNWIPRALENAAVVREGDVVPLLPGTSFRVVTWNLQFAATRRHHFFYEGGRAVSVPPADVHAALDGILEVLARLAPDLLLLQEVDRASRRTSFLDELAWILGGHPMPRWVSTPIHRSRHVPHPAHEHLGAMDLHQVVASRFELLRAHRHALPALREPALRRAFNLKRALLAADLGPGDVATTHLSAFSRGDGTLPAQVETLLGWIDARGDRPWILGGDLNLLPPGDDPARLGADAVEYADHPPPLARLLARARSVVPPEHLLDAANRTYVPPGASEPDRVLDYLFVSPSIGVRRAWVEPIPDWLSDHRPLVADLVWPS